MNAATDTRTVREALALLVTLANQHGTGSPAATPADLGRQVAAYLERQQAELSALRSCLQEFASEVGTIAIGADRLLAHEHRECIEPSRAMVCQIGAMADLVRDGIGQPQVFGDLQQWLMPSGVMDSIAALRGPLHGLPPDRQAPHP